MENSWVIRGHSSLIAFFHRCSGEQARSVFRNRSSEVGSPCRGSAGPSTEVGSPCRSLAGPSSEVGSPCRGSAGPSSEVGSPCRSFAGPSSEVGSPCRGVAGRSSEVGSPCRSLAGPSSEVGSLIYTGGGRPPSKGCDTLILSLGLCSYSSSQLSQSMPPWLLARAGPLLPPP